MCEGKLRHSLGASMENTFDWECEMVRGKWSGDLREI